MKTKTVLLSLLASGAGGFAALALGAGVAHAQTLPATSPGPAAVAAPLAPRLAVNAPVTIAGNPVAVVGRAVSAPAGGSGRAATSPPPGHHGRPLVAVTAPVTVTGNPVAVAGRSSTTGSATPSSGASANAPRSGGSPSREHVPAVATLTAPVTVAGNPVGVAGRSTTTTPSSAAEPGTATQPAGRNGLIDANIPVVVCGDAVSLLAQATGGCGTATDADRNSDPTQTAAAPTSVDLAAPVDACGNAVGVLGRAGGDCSTNPPSSPPTTQAGLVDMTAPVDVCGNSIGVLGGASGNCVRSASTPTSLPNAGGPSNPGGLTDGGGSAPLTGGGGATDGNTPDLGAGARSGTAGTATLHAVSTSTSLAGPPHEGSTPVAAVGTSLAFTGLPLVAALSLVGILLLLGGLLLTATRPRRSA